MAWIIAFGLSVGASEPAMDRASIGTFLNKVPAMNLRGFDHLSDGTKSWDETVPEILAKVFDGLNQTTFGRPLFKLRFCSFCLANANLRDFEVQMEPRFLDKIHQQAASSEDERLLLTFVVAHEMAHYIYELIVDDSGRSRSFNGNKSFGELIESGFLCTRERQRAHAEVDLIALILVERAGFSGAAPRLSKFIAGLNFSCDGHFRASSLAHH